MYNDVTGIILSGGKSSRMGVNKAFLRLKGKSMIEHTAELMTSLFQRVIIITNDTEDYEFLGLEMFNDIFPGNGPLGGIHSGLYHSKTEKNFIISCDMPLVSRELIEFLSECKTAFPATLARAEGHIQHLCGIYGRSLLIPAESLCRKNLVPVNPTEKRKCSVHSLLDNTGAEIIESYSIPCYREEMFLNMNRPDDYRIFLEKYEASVENTDNFD